MSIGLRRSALYVPGDIPKMLQRSVSSGADLLLLNLEDGVASSRKAEARANVAGAMRALDFAGREIVVRVNPPATVIGREDLAAVVPCRPDGICLPKVESAAAVCETDVMVGELEKAHRIPEGSLRFHAMIESARGVLEAAAIARASRRMASLVFGSADYVADVGCRPGQDRHELGLALQMIVTSARSGQIDAIDAPCFEIRNLELVRREAEQARRLGFSGKSALHPIQIESIHAAFDVTPDELAWAEQVLSELDSAEGQGRALATVGGHLIDNPHRLAAERIVRRSLAARDIRPEA
jgi:citrate lyase subunit beta/citryl-CoA lyase